MTGDEAATPQAAARTCEATQVRRARHAVSVVFIASGVAFASWASRIPQVRAELRVSPGVLGLVLLCLAVGSAVGTLLSGIVVGWLGESRAVAVMSVVGAAGLAATALGYTHGIAAVAVGLFVYGFGNATWDVAMNVQAAAVEQALGRAIMPRFHAGWSVGTVAGAGVGAAMVALGVPVTAHLLAVAVIVALVVPASARRFLPRDAGGAVRGSFSPAGAPADLAGNAPARPGSGGLAARLGPLRAWTERRTLTIGLFALCMGFSEGTGDNWLSLAVIDGYHTAVVLGTVAYALFLVAMTAGRWFGPRLLDAYGRVRVLRALAVTACAGLLCVDFGDVLPLAWAGAVLLGLGASLGIPVSLTAAADDARHAATRVSTVASTGYAAFLAGPPAVGFLADHVGVQHSLSLAAVLLAAAFLLAPATAALSARAEP